MITNIATALGCAYLASRQGILNALDGAARSRQQPEIAVAMTDSFTTGYCNMAMIAGVLAAPQVSAELGAAMMVRDSYVHREKLKTAVAWCQAKLPRRPLATVHPILKVAS